MSTVCTAEFDSEEILKICQHTTNLCARLGCAVFLAHGVYFVISSSEMLKPRWLRSSHVTVTINTLLLLARGCNMTVNNSL